MKVSIEQIDHHPLNKEIYDLSSIDDLVNSISFVGLLQPLTINQKNLIISGNRRFEAIKRLGWEEVEVNKIQTKEEEDILYLIHFNKQRVKTPTELLAEYDNLKTFYKDKIKIDKTITSVRNEVADKMNLSYGQLARLLFIRKHNPEHIDLLNKGIITINQSYLQTQREVNDLKSREYTPEPIKGFTNKDNFTFHLKSSINLTEIKDGEVNLIMTSPPYFFKRKYTTGEELGCESSPTEYVNNLVKHLDDCYRVLNPRGSFFLNIGDSFQNGNLQNIPHRVVIKLQEKGWILRNSIIWKKTNPKPSSSKNNLNPSYEFIFHLVKCLDYDYEHTLIPLSENTKPSHPPRHRGVNEYKIKNISPYIPNKNGKKMSDFWDDDIVKTAVVNQHQNNGIEHPAMFPKEIVYLPILQTCVYPHLNNQEYSPLVLDIFAGSLTTYKVVDEINKNFKTKIRFIGYDIKKYF